MKNKLCCEVHPVFSCPYCHYKICEQHLPSARYPGGRLNELAAYDYHQRVFKNCPNKGRFLKEKFGLKTTHRKVYVVTRDYNSPSGVINVPNLGVHSSLLRAQEHLGFIIKDRTSHMGGVIRCDLKWEDPPGSNRTLRKLRIEYPNSQAEELRIEMWEV